MRLTARILCPVASNRIAVPGAQRAPKIQVEHQLWSRVDFDSLSSSVAIERRVLNMMRSTGVPVAVIVAVLAAIANRGLRLRYPLDPDPLTWYWQYIEPALLKERLLESLFYLHSQPPLFNLLLGLTFKAFRTLRHRAANRVHRDGPAIVSGLLRAADPARGAAVAANRDHCVTVRLPRCCSMRTGFSTSSPDAHGADLRVSCVARFLAPRVCSGGHCVLQPRGRPHLSPLRVPVRVAACLVVASVAVKPRRVVLACCALPFCPRCLALCEELRAVRHDHDQFVARHEHRQGHRFSSSLTNEPNS